MPRPNAREIEESDGKYDKRGLIVRDDDDDDEEPRDLLEMFDDAPKVRVDHLRTKGLPIKAQKRGPGAGPGGSHKTIKPQEMRQLVYQALPDAISFIQESMLDEDRSWKDRKECAKILLEYGLSKPTDHAAIGLVSPNTFVDLMTKKNTDEGASLEIKLPQVAAGA